MNKIPIDIQKNEKRLKKERLKIERKEREEADRREAEVVKVIEFLKSHKGKGFTRGEIVRKVFGIIPWFFDDSNKGYAAELATKSNSHIKTSWKGERIYYYED